MSALEYFWKSFNWLIAQRNEMLPTLCEANARLAAGLCDARELNDLVAAMIELDRLAWASYAFFCEEVAKCEAE
jgi:hypothetical protein